MKKIFVLFLLLILSGCVANDTHLTYNQAVGLGEKLVNQDVVWIGQVASELSQIGGIKFWIIDDDHPMSSQKQEYEWFWAVDSATMSLPMEANGRWAAYLMKKFVGNYDCVDCLYEVRGELSGIDCDLYDKELFGKNVCIPSVNIWSIKKL